MVTLTPNYINKHEGLAPNATANDAFIEDTLDLLCSATMGQYSILLRIVFKISKWIFGYDFRRFLIFCKERNSTLVLNISIKHFSYYSFFNDTLVTTTTILFYSS